MIGRIWRIYPPPDGAKERMTRPKKTKPLN